MTAWFGRSAARRTAPAHWVRVRAAEKSSLDYSQHETMATPHLFDPYGRMYRPLPPDVRGPPPILPYDFPQPTKTIYTRYGDWFPWLCVAISIILFLWDPW